MGKLVTQTNDRFGRLVALIYFKNKNGFFWICKCDCDNYHITKYLRNGKTKSCGCYKKETRPLAEWSEILNIPYKTLITRISRGWDIEKAFNKKSSKEKYIIYNGEEKTLEQWSKITGLPIGCISTRLLRGWSLEKVFKTPVNECGGRRHAKQS